MTPVADIAPSPSYTIAEDHDQGVIRMEVKGFFDLDTLAQHFADNAIVVDRWRTMGQPVRVYINAVALKPHSPEGQACVQKAVARIYRPGDKLAIRVESSLVKTQMRRALSHGDLIEFFISESALMTWLTA